MDYSKILSKTAVELKPSGIRKFFDLLGNMDDVVALTVGQPDFATPWHIRDAGIDSIADGHTFYTSNRGTPEMRRELAAYMTIVSAIYLPFEAYANAAYFTIRSGGRVLMTFLLDAGFMWAIVVPASLCIAHFTNLDIMTFYPLCQGASVLKPLLGFYFIRRGTWARQLVAD